MADMFGAPLGIGAAEKDMREQVQGVLAAQQTLSSIGLQSAHAKLYEQEAAQKELAVAQAREDLKLGAEFQQQEAQRALASATAGAQGRAPTVNDVGWGGQEPANSLTGRLARQIKFMEDHGVSETRLIPLKEKLATISEKTAITGYRNAQALEQQQKVLKERAERQGRFATAALENPSLYPIMLQKALTDSDPEVVKAASQLPPTWSPLTAKLMQTLRTQGIDTARAAELKIQTARLGVEQAQQKTAERKANAYIALSEARRGLETEKLALIRKLGGETSEAAKRQKESAARARDIATDAKLDKLFPAMPLDINTAIPGQGYSAVKNGKKVYFHYLGKGPDGRPMVEPATVSQAKQFLNEPSGGIAGPAEEED